MCPDNLLLVLKALTASALKTLKVMSELGMASGCKVSARESEILS
jgi:hypothetical protein